MIKYIGTGTKQWSTKSINFQTGCEHGCLYCYAKEGSVRRNQSTKKGWNTPLKREHDIKKKRNKWEESLIMFPSTHDITPNNIAEAKLVLSKILRAGNEVLIVSKPHYDCIKQICDEFSDYKDKILFRFSIGSYDNKVLKFWEPAAPGLQERLKALEYAFNSGYQTSISCEPMLDNKIDKVINAVKPFVTETIWLGKMNSIESRLNRNNDMTDEIRTKAAELQQWQSDDNIMLLYHKYNNDPIIRWKDSIEKVIKKNSKKINSKGDDKL